MKHLLLPVSLASPVPPSVRVGGADGRGTPGGGSASPSVRSASGILPPPPPSLLPPGTRGGAVFPRVSLRDAAVGAAEAVSAISSWSCSRASPTRAECPGGEGEREAGTDPPPSSPAPSTSSPPSRAVSWASGCSSRSSIREGSPPSSPSLRPPPVPPCPWRWVRPPLFLPSPPPSSSLSLSSSLSFSSPPCALGALTGSSISRPRRARTARAVLMMIACIRSGHSMMRMRRVVLSTMVMSISKLVIGDRVSYRLAPRWRSRADRSYVYPSAATTGSRMTVLRIGQRNSLGISGRSAGAPIASRSVRRRASALASRSSPRARSKAASSLAQCAVGGKSSVQSSTSLIAFLSASASSPGSSTCIASRRPSLHLPRWIWETNRGQMWSSVKTPAAMSTSPGSACVMRSILAAVHRCSLSTCHVVASWTFSIRSARATATAASSVEWYVAFHRVPRHAVTRPSSRENESVASSYPCRRRLQRAPTPGVPDSSSSCSPPSNRPSTRKW